MATVEETREGSLPVETRWYALQPDEVMSNLGVALSVGVVRR